MKLPKDKLGHLKAGAQAAIVGVATGGLTGAAAYSLGAVPPVVMLLCAAVGAYVASSVAGVTKEMADKADNALRASQGLPPLHSVEVLDAVATSLPGWVIGSGLFLSMYWAQ